MPRFFSSVNSPRPTSCISHSDRVVQALASCLPYSSHCVSSLPQSLLRRGTQTGPMPPRCLAGRSRSRRMLFESGYTLSLVSKCSTFDLCIFSSRCPVAQEGDVALFEPCGWEQLPAMEKGIGMSTHDPSCIKTKPLQTHPQCLRLYAKPGEWRRTASVLGESWLCMRRFED